MRKRPPELLGINVNEIARICRVSLKTAMRWKDGQTVPPQTALMILAGDLGCFDPAWRGWIIRKGVLISQEGWELTPGETLAVPLMRAQIAAYQLQQRQSDAIEEQPLPGEAPAQITA